MSKEINTAPESFYAKLSKGIKGFCYENEIRYLTFACTWAGAAGVTSYVDDSPARAIANAGLSVTLAYILGQKVRARIERNSKS